MTGAKPVRCMSPQPAAPGYDDTIGLFESCQVWLSDLHPFTRF